jgi:hypothetical protein
MTSIVNKKVLVSGFLMGLGVLAVGACGGSGYNVTAKPLHGSEMLVRTALNEQLCWDAKNDKAAGGTPLMLWKCHGKENQRWTFADQPGGTNTLLGVGGLCVDVKGHRAGDGTPLQLWPCTNQSNQQFRHNSDGRIVETQTGKCLTAKAAADNTPITIDECDVNNGGQVWTIAK